MEGLEISELKLSEVQENNDSFRFDSEFFHKEYFHLLDFLSSKSHVKLGEITSWITQGPNPNFCEPDDFSVPCLTGRNINKGRVNYLNSDFVDASEYKSLTRFQIRSGDTLVTLKGKGSIGKIGYVTDERKAIFSRDIGIIRPSGVNHAYVNAYILSKYGQKLIARGETGGTGQSTLTTSYLKSLFVPRLSIEEMIGNLILRSEDVLKKHQAEYKKAESLLLDTLGMTNFSPSTEAINVKSFKDSFAATGRLDAEYYQPKYEDYERVMVSHPAGFTTIVKEFDLVKETSQREKSAYNYIEISDVSVADGTASFNRLEVAELPANAKQEVQRGDLLISKVRPNRGAIAIIDFDDTDLIVSGAFTVLREKSESVFSNETLKVLLRTQMYRDWMLKFNIGTQYPVIRDDDILNLPIPCIDDKTQIRIAALVKESFSLKVESNRLLNIAKRAVEIAIEQDENAGLAYIKVNS